MCCKRVGERKWNEEITITLRELIGMESIEGETQKTFTKLFTPKKGYFFLPLYNIRYYQSCKSPFILLHQTSFNFQGKKADIVTKKNSFK